VPFRNFSLGPHIAKRMSASRFLPVQCASCAATYLTPVVQRVATCRNCGDVASVLPGEAYGEQDVPLFERIEAATRSVVVSRRQAERIVEELSGLTTRSERPEAVLLRVVDLVPALHFLVPALQVFKPNQRVPLLRAAGMVLSIFSARLRRLERPQAS
jgi:ribosomal protein S27E